ncbi:MAG: hypothetical protein COV73_04915 [Candidatus Omnitrophica bacterium CG11_big_fil_rev_8_21_14_0_20_43_6]|nr:MAG: hypothetical protein COV73_04915 [Candidatus Omnitrophica bacterium CG11_big_fil_rev_8_21_14_0_20_43_6]
MLDQALKTIKRLTVSRHHSGAGENVSAYKLIRQGLPYYLNKNGYAYFPLTLFFVINGKCNLRCRMCDVGQQNKDSMFYKNLKGENAQDFPFERFKTLIDEVHAFKPYIGITTTEPLLYSHIFDAIKYARAKGMDMNISTNGVLIEKYYKEIIDSGLHRLSVSLDGPEHIHDKMRGVPGTYESVLRGLQLLKEEKKMRGSGRPHIYISSYITDNNYAYLTEFLENFPLGGIERINMKLMVFFTKAMVLEHNKIFQDTYPATAACVANDFLPENLDIDKLCSQAKEIKRRFGHICTLHFEADKDKLKKYFYRPDKFMDDTRCILPWFVAQITAKGDLIALTRCYNVSLGNIMDKPFKEVWNGQKMRKFRKDLQRLGRFPGCARCDGVLYR